MGGSVILECLVCGHALTFNIPASLGVWDWFEEGQEPICGNCGGLKYKATDINTGEITGPSKKGGS